MLAIVVYVFMGLDIPLNFANCVMYLKYQKSFILLYMCMLCQDKYIQNIFLNTSTNMET